MATWKKLIIEGSNISELTNDSGFITSTSGALSTSGGTLTGNLGIPNKITHNDDTGTYLAFTDGQIDLKGSGGVRLMISDNEHINFYTGSSSDTALNLSSDQSANFYGNITVSKDDGFVYLNNVGTGNDGVYIRGTSADNIRLNVPANKYCEWEVGGVYKAKIDTNGLQVGTAGNDTSTSLRVNTGIIIHKDTGAEGNDVSLTFDRRSDGATAYVKCTAGDDGAYATNLSLITKGHNGSAYQLYTGLTIDDEGRALIQGGTPLTAEGVNKRLKIHGSGDNYVLTGCYDDNGWGYFNSYNNANGMQFYIDAGIYSFRNGKMMIGVESSGTATSANLFIIGANNAGDGIKISRAGDSQNALDQYAQLNMNQGTTNLISRGGTSSEGTIAFQTTADGSTHNTRMYINASGQIGINNSSPAGKIDIVGGDGTVSGTPDSDGDELVIRNNADAGLSILAGESSGHTSTIVFGSTSDLNGANVFYEYNTKTMKLGTQHSDGILTLRSGNGSDALTINASQNVGIGESVPLAKCHIFTGDSGITSSANTSADELIIEGSGDSGLSIWTPANKSGTLVFSREGATSVGSIKYHHVNDGTGPNSLIFTTASTTALTLDANQKATFTGDIVTDDNITANSDAGKTVLSTSGSNAVIDMNDSTPAHKVRIHAGGDSFLDGGKLGIGNQSPSKTLHVTGEVRFTMGTASVDFDTVGGDGHMAITDSDSTVKINLDAEGDNYLNGGNLGIGRTPLGTAYGFTSNTFLEVGTGSTNIAGVLELVGKTYTDGTGIGHILFRNEQNSFTSGVNYWGGSGEGAGRISLVNYGNSSSGGDQGSEMQFWTKAYGGDCAKRITINHIGHIGIGKTPIRILDVEGSLAGQYGGGVHNSSTTGHGFFIKGAPNSNNYNAFLVDNQEGTTLHTIKGNGIAEHIATDFILNGRWLTDHTTLKIQSNADNNYDAILQWDAEDTMAWQLYNDGSDSNKLKLGDAGGTTAFVIDQNCDITIKEDLKVEGALSVDGAYPFMINASADWKGTSSELNMPFTESGTTTASPSTGSDLKTQMTWVAPFATTLRAMYVTSETAVTDAQFKVEVASTYSVFVNGTSTTTTTYTKSFTTGASANISCGLAIAKGNALRFSINPNSTAVDQFLVTFVFE